MISLRPNYTQRYVVIAGLILTLLLTASRTYGEDFKRALPGRTFSFPRDHFSHPEFRTEWWYYSGHLNDQEKRSYGYQLTFFRTGIKREATAKSKWAIQNLYFAHLALTDESNKKFQYREKIHRGSLGESGASDKTFRVWIEDWSLEGKGPAMRDHFLKAGDRELGIELTLTPQRNPVIHGQNGISQKAEGEGYASHYYSITRLKTEGKIFLKDREFPVQGTSWMDHEFGSAQLRDYQVGWDWFSIRLENGTDLMLYQLRHRDGKVDPYSSGTIMFQDGSQRHLPLKGFQIEVLERWKSKKSGATYPSRWRVKVPKDQIDLLLTPVVKDQELITEVSTGITYWEGSVRIEGKYGNISVKGLGYVELTGYAKPLTGKI